MAQNSVMQIIVLIVLFLPKYFVKACAPMPNGYCYAGQYALGSGYQYGYAGSVQNQQCGGIDWCAVTYLPNTQQAQFGCANQVQTYVGTPLCGDGPGYVNHQGCKMVDTTNGPCYICCCRGGSCNHPQIFAREAYRLARSSPSAPYQQSVPLPWYSPYSASGLKSYSLMLIVITIVFIGTVEML